jgi:predicted secreted hydrolase
LHGERSARAGFGLAEAREGGLDVAIDDWSLRAKAANSYRAMAVADGFSLDLQFESVGAPMLNGREGFSQKSPDPARASYYYSQPHLQVNGRVVIGKRAIRVTGTAWLDHEWSTEPLDPAARGWDWLGVNCHDGGALMVSRIRTSDAKQHWAFATWRSPEGTVTTFSPGAIEWLPGRSWSSPRTGIDYPVEWTVKVGGRALLLRPLMDDQESDSRGSTGTIYWEGATRVFDEQNRQLGRGYLELTGYGERLRL